MSAVLVSDAAALAMGSLDHDNAAVAPVEPAWLVRLQNMMGADAPQADEALLVDYPVDVGLRRQEWRHDLLREFQLITFGSHEHSSQLTVPRRLLALADEMTQRYGHLIEQHTAELERALAAGAQRVVLRYPLVPAARTLEIEFARAMEESDAYCREQALMTVEPTRETYALRRWVAEEVVRQYDGHPPRAWPQFLTEAAPELFPSRA